MGFHLIHPGWLWLAPIFAGLLVIFRRRNSVKQGLARAGLYSLPFIFITLAAAGLTVERNTRKNQVVVAADISDSIFERSAQTQRVRELLSALEPETTQAAMVLFGKTQSLERPMGSLASAAQADLSNPAAVVSASGTDIAGALRFARTAFTQGDGGRAVLLLSDFRDTQNTPTALAAEAAALDAAGIALLSTPAILGATSDVRLAEFFAPERASVGRGIPLEITVAGQKAVELKVRVTRAAAGEATVFVDAKTVKLEAPGKNDSRDESCATVRILDHAAAPGVALYTATVSGPDGTLTGDVLINNSLSAAVRIDGPSKWALLTRRDSTLERLARDTAKPLGADVEIFFAGNFPSEAARYESFSGVLLDGLSASELAEGSAALRALQGAINAGKALVAVGGNSAFGAGGHTRGGTLEALLPIEMTPEDSRARAVLFLLDVSRSMDERFTPRGGSATRKLDFAAGQLQAVQKLRPQDRLGLVEFSANATLSVPLSADPSRSSFLDAVRSVKIENNTDLLPALQRAKQVFDADNADEKLALLISDGIQTVARPREEILRAAEALCPATAGETRRRTTLWTFGIGVERDDSNSAGEQLLKDLAAAGGGKYSPDFLNLGEQLSKTFDEGKKDFYLSRDAVVPRVTTKAAPLYVDGVWPELHFHNRVKAKSGADTILSSAAANLEAKSKSDPLLVLSGPVDESFSRRAALALSIDGPEGGALLAAGSAGRTLLASVMSWAEARAGTDKSDFTIVAEPGSQDNIEIELRAFDMASGEPRTSLSPQALLTVLKHSGDGSAVESKPVKVVLKQVAPGIYRATIDAPPASVCRLAAIDSGKTLAERFVSTPSAAEARRFGVDRAAMAELVTKAGPLARVVESPRDLAAWAAANRNASGGYDLRAWLLGAALVLFLIRWSRR